MIINYFTITSIPTGPRSGDRIRCERMNQFKGTLEVRLADSLTGLKNSPNTVREALVE